MGLFNYQVTCTGLKCKFFSMVLGQFDMVIPKKNTKKFWVVYFCVKRWTNLTFRPVSKNLHIKLCHLLTYMDL